MLLKITGLNKGNKDLNSDTNHKAKLATSLSGWLCRYTKVEYLQSVPEETRTITVPSLSWLKHDFTFTSNQRFSVITAVFLLKQYILQIWKHYTIDLSAVSCDASCITLSLH